MRKYIACLTAVALLSLGALPEAAPGKKSKKRKSDPPSAPAPSAPAPSAPQKGGWQLRDVGGGGAVSALAVGPYIAGKDGSWSNLRGDLFVGSDMSGVYARPAGKPEFVARHQGLIFNKVLDGIVSERGSSTHVHGIDVANDLVVAATSGGVIYRSTDRGAHWTPVFDSLRESDGALFQKDSEKVAFGSVAISAGAGNDSHNVVVGVGEPKQLKRGKEKSSGKRASKKAETGESGVLSRLPKEFAYKVLVSEDSGRTWQKVDLCNKDCPAGKDDLGHVISIAATRDKSKFWIATVGAVFLLEKTGSAWSARNQSIGAPRPRSWKVLSVQPSFQNDADVLVLTAGDAPEGILWQSTNATAQNVTWTNVSKTFGQKLERAGSYGPFAKLIRSRSRPQEAVVMGSKNDDNGVWFTRDFASGEWMQVVSNAKVGEFAADAWTRFDLSSPQRFKGTSELAIAEDAGGIREIYVAGFAGMVVRAERDAKGFRVHQIHSQTVSRSGPPRYRGAGEISLGSSKGGVLTDTAGGNLAVFLYGDNGFFVTDDLGASFLRPVKSWLFGTGGMIHGKRVAISFSRGNHLESAKEGGIYYSADGGASFQELDTSGLRRNVFTQVLLSRENTDLFGLVPGEGVFTAPAGGRWRSYNEGLGKNVEHLREGMLGKTQLLLAATSQGKGMELYARAPALPKSSWQRVASLRENVDGLWFLEGKLVVLSDNQILVGAFPEQFTDKGLTVRFAAPIRAPEAGNVPVRIADVTLCRDTIYAATADGVWKYALGKTSWSATAATAYRPFWRISSNQSCGLFAGASGAGNYYAAGF